MEYIISDTHFLHKNIWKYDFSRVIALHTQLANMSTSELKKANILEWEYQKIYVLVSIPELLEGDGWLSFVQKVGDKMMIYNWNKTVNKNDTVYHLGDLTMGSTREYEDIVNIVSQLNGNIHLILGNHDQRQMINHLLDDNLLESVEEFGLRKKMNHKIYYLCHYGVDVGGESEVQEYYEKYNKLPRGMRVCLHGHIHENNYSSFNKLNMSVDNNLSYQLTNYHLGQPIPWPTIDKYIDDEFPIHYDK